MSDCNGVLCESDAETDDGALTKHIVRQAEIRKNIPHWGHIVGLGISYPMAIYGFWLFISSGSMKTNLFSIFLGTISLLGISIGAHRLWSHRSFRAKLPLRILLAIFQTIAYHYSILEWSRLHRVHHKYSETDADPFNATRGFFFAHIGWLFVHRHPDSVEKEKRIDISDLMQDPIVRFQHRFYYLPLMPLCCFVMPFLIPVYAWNETWLNSWCIAVMLRWIFVSNLIFTVNSIAHKWGNKPYDKNLSPVDNIAISALTLGEGWHNYHHAFPWDYKTSEWGNHRLNISTILIDFCAKIGWAYDLKSVSNAVIEKRCKRTGDKSHPIWGREI